jgi:aminopeptidase N
MPNCSKSQYYLELARDTLDFYIDYFNIPYPLPKMDIIGLTDLEFGAMENWGAITFSEDILEVIAKQWDDTEGIETTIRNCRLICHEIAHMWFGNLVTMEWVTRT